MKIAFAYDSAYPWFNGGIEKREYNIMRALAAKGHNVHLFTMFREGMPGMDFTYEKIRYHCAGKALPTKDMYKNGRRNISWPLKYALLVFPKIIKYRFDILDADAFPFLDILPFRIYCTLRRVRFAITWAEVWNRQYWREYLGRLGFLGYVFQGIAARSADRVITNSEHTAQSFCRQYGFPIKKIFPFPAAIDGDEIRSIPRKKAKKDYFVIVGRLVPEKRVEMAIKALGKCRSGLHVIGFGPEKERLTALAKELGFKDRVVFKEKLERKELLLEIAGARAMLMMSKREGLSIISLEALALGTQVVVVKSTIIPQEVRRYCRIVTDTMLGNELERVEKSSTALPARISQEVIEKFSTDRAESLYKGLLQ